MQLRIFNLSYFESETIFIPLFWMVFLLAFSSGYFIISSCHLFLPLEHEYFTGRIGQVKFYIALTS